MSIKSLGDISLARLVDNFKTRANSMGTRISAMEGKIPGIKIPSSVGMLSVINNNIPTEQNQFTTWWSGFINYIITFSTLNLSSAFSTCTNLTSVDFSGCDLSNVTSASSMFYKCTNLTSVDFSGCDLSKVTGTSGMFSDCTSLTSVDFSGCDLSNVTSGSPMSQMFENCTNLVSVDFSNSNIRKLYYDTFKNCSNLTSVDFSGCDLSNATGIHGTSSSEHIFYTCTKLTSLIWGGAISATPLDLTKTKLTPAAAEAFFNSVSTKTKSSTIQIRMPVTATGADTSGITAKGYTVTFATS